MFCRICSFWEWPQKQQQSSQKACPRRWWLRSGSWMFKNTMVDKNKYNLGRMQENKKKNGMMLDVRGWGRFSVTVLWSASRCSHKPEGLLPWPALPAGRRSCGGGSIRRMKWIPVVWAIPHCWSQSVTEWTQPSLVLYAVLCSQNQREESWSVCQ